MEKNRFKGGKVNGLTWFGWSTVSRKSINEKLIGDQAEKQAKTKDVNVRQGTRFYSILSGNYIEIQSCRVRRVT